MKTVLPHGDHIGARIKAARIAAGLTTMQLAEKTGLRQTSIYGVEYGRFRPGRETAERIAAAVGVELSTLIRIDGSPDVPLRRRGPRGASWSAEYFWQRVDRRGPDECWPWTGALNDNGYGSVAFRAKPAITHRVAYELSGRPIPDGLELDHTCHDPATCHVPPSECPHRRCCNPAHLKAVTHAVNLSRRSDRRGGGSGKGSRYLRTGRPQSLNPGITVNQRFGLYLRTARNKAGLTQDELGEMVGLSEPAISLIESGKRGTTETRRAAFIAALNLDLGDLLRHLNSAPSALPASAPESLFEMKAAS